MFPIRSIHQIEMTSRCNLRCRYCVHPTMARTKLDMDERTYVKSLWWARQLRGRELNLAGIGESTMHPEFVRYVFLAREAIGDDTDLILATNGLLMTNELARAIAPSKIRVWVSLHRPEKAGPAVEALKAAGILAGVSGDPSIAAVNWAGQVKWHVSTPQKGTICPWVRPGRVFILSDGQVARCCFDATAEDVLGTIDDDLLTMQTSPYKLCDSCHHDVGVQKPHEAQVNYRNTVSGGISVP